MKRKTELLKVKSALLAAKVEHKQLEKTMRSGNIFSPQRRCSTLACKDCCHHTGRKLPPQMKEEDTTANRWRRTKTGTMWSRMGKPRRPRTG